MDQSGLFMRVINFLASWRHVGTIPLVHYAQPLHWLTVLHSISTRSSFMYLERTLYACNRKDSEGIDSKQDRQFKIEKPTASTFATLLLPSYLISSSYLPVVVSTFHYRYFHHHHHYFILPPSRCYPPLPPTPSPPSPSSLGPSSAQTGERTPCAGSLYA